MPPIRTFGAVPQSIFRKEIKNCSSIGFSRRKSRSPVRTSSANSLKLSRKRHLGQSVDREVAAHEEEVLRLGPVGDMAGPGEDRLVKGDHDPQPEDLDRDLDQEVAPERQFAVQRVTAQVAKQPEVLAGGREHRLTLQKHCSASAPADRVRGKGA